MGIEEHFVTAGIRAAWAASPIGQEGTGGFDRGEIEERLDDLEEQRLALMEESVTLARRTNDLIAATIAKYRTRFQGFATLPTAAPKEAAAELERAVTRLGLVGPCCAVAHARRTWIIQTSYHYFRPPRDLAFLCLCTLRYRNAPSGRFTTQVSAT